MAHFQGSFGLERGQNCLQWAPNGQISIVGAPQMVQDHFRENTLFTTGNKQKANLADRHLMAVTHVKYNARLVRSTTHPTRGQVWTSPSHRRWKRLHSARSLPRVRQASGHHSHSESRHTAVGRQPSNTSTGAPPRLGHDRLALHRKWVGGRAESKNTLPERGRGGGKPTVTSTVSLPLATSKKQIWQTDISWFIFPQ